MENAKRAQQRLKDRGFDIVVDGDFGASSFAALMSWVGKRQVSTLRTAFGKAAASRFPGVQITSALRVAHALAQQSVETGGFSQVAESFNYTPEGLRATFPVDRISTPDCKRLGRKPGETVVPQARQEEIANIVYGDIWGVINLGNDREGDGWRFRGRGAKQITGRDNYTRTGTALSLDLVGHPELLENPDTGMRAGCHFWKTKGCNALADADDIIHLTEAINGGHNGLPERKQALDRAKIILL